MDWFKKRMSEGSTWAGLAVSILGIGQLAKVNEAPLIAEGVKAVGDAYVATGGDWAATLVSGLTIGGGVIAAILREKG